MRRADGRAVNDFEDERPRIVQQLEHIRRLGVARDGYGIHGIDLVKELHAAEPRGAADRHLGMEFGVPKNSMSVDIRGNETRVNG